MEKAFDGYTVTRGLQAVVVLLIAFGLRIAQIKPADTVEKLPTGFSKFIGKSKTNVAPIGLIGGDVGLGGFELEEDLGDFFESVLGGIVINTPPSRR